MKNILLAVVFLFTISISNLYAGTDSKVVEHLEAVSVTISSGNAQGSGVVKTRTRGNETLNLVWTAGHVVEGLRRTREVVQNGVTKTVVFFDDAKIIKTLVEDGRNVGKLEIFASVIRYNKDEDVALLRVRQKNFLKDGVQFYLEEKIPAIGVPLCHVGSLLGELGSNSYTTGVLSQQGRLIDGKIFDQTTVTAFPGSSGGGVYLEDGRMVGQILRGAGEQFNLIIPIRRIVSWAKAAKVEWAVNDSVPVPNEEILKKLPVEDTGVVFTPEVQRIMEGAHSPKKMLYVKPFDLKILPYVR